MLDKIHKLKKTPWYKMQRQARKDLIMGHIDFCCPVTGTVLDMDRSFIVHKATIVSQEGFSKLVEQDENNFSLLNTDVF